MPLFWSQPMRPFSLAFAAFATTALVLYVNAAASLV
jgi:hypothetical protein